LNLLHVPKALETEWKQTSGAPAWKPLLTIVSEKHTIATIFRNDISGGVVEFMVNVARRIPKKIALSD
jgi:hypothetical protein